MRRRTIRSIHIAAGEVTEVQYNEPYAQVLDGSSNDRLVGSNGTLLEPTKHPTRRVAPRLGTRRGACRSRQQPDALRTQRSRGGKHALHAERRGVGDDLLA